MRLEPEIKKKIMTILEHHFGCESQFFLFGSRVDNSKRGGDIDLLIECKNKTQNLESLKLSAMTDIQLSIGIQKIDLIVTQDLNNDKRLVVVEALKVAIPLTK